MGEHLVAGQVALTGAGLVGGGDNHDRDGDRQPEADRGQSRCRSRLVATEIAERDPGRQRRPPGESAGDANGGRGDQDETEGRGDHADDHERDAAGVLRWIDGNCETGDAAGEQHQCREDGPASSARRLGPTRQRRHDRLAGDHSCWPPRGGDGGGDGECQSSGDNPPRDVEAPEATADGLLESRSNSDPRTERDERTGTSRHDTNRSASGEHDGADVPLGGAGGSEQPELPLPALGDDDEGGGGDEGHEEHRHGCGDENADGRERLLARAARFDAPARRRGR